MRFYVKDKSVTEFFIQHHASFRGIDVRDIRENNVYNLFKDEITLTKSAIFDNVNEIEFELEDASRGSNKALVNTYVYSIEEYDSVSVVLKLVNFKVTQKPNEPIKVS